MIVRTYPDLIFSAPTTNVYVFTIEARNGAEAATLELTPAQIDAARQAAAAVLEVLGAEATTTSSVLTVGADDDAARLVIRATLENDAPMIAETEPTDEAAEEPTETDEATEE